MNKYDIAIENLTKLKDDPVAYADAIKTAWFNPSKDVNGCLFQFCKAPGKMEDKIGCLIMVKLGGVFKACTPELTQKIRNDNRIPTHYSRITPKLLPVFQEYQELMDRTIRTTVP